LPILKQEAQEIGIFMRAYPLVAVGGVLAGIAD
jgi:hypothetical protein